MAGQTITAMENGDAKLQKKHKNKQKRKHGGATDSEFDSEQGKGRNVEENGNPIIDAPPELSAKKKKKNKQKNDAISNDDASEETPRKKKKKTKKDEEEAVTQKEANGVEGADQVREGNGVVVSGKNVNDSKYRALDSFSESALPGEILDCCKTFDKPSPIQSNSWPYLLDGRDFIGIAATGSGKTIAFGVPAIVHVLNKRKSKATKKMNPSCLVLSPTRELAQQISDVLCDAGKPSGVSSVCVYGGTSKGPQISSLKSGVDIVIGTPGRLKDLIEMGVCQLKDVSFVVLDEADRMLDMGFEPEVRSILRQTCPVRQMVMFSATWPLPVHQLAQEFMDPNPVKVVVGSEDLAANHDVLQIVEVLDDRARDQRLQELLEKYHKSRKNRVLVFVLYKKEASRVENMLQKRGWKAVSISGDKAQNARTQALSQFKDGKSPLLIATDVAARGLDIPDVEVVINYSFPLTTEDYVHRIGRTGRAGKKGVAHTFFMKENKALSGELINVLREAKQVVPESLLKFGTHVKKKESKLYGAHFREIGANAPKEASGKHRVFTFLRDEWDILCSVICFDG
ncbi:DEAD-box ATP-dependent RNA helicase 5 isoform X2 [Andrographis paniculata]|uniref:DEAD-box ATP-dependent RNA helicase 5 isoform X2 n=1 Tax=Andrographis paniculata TaxID=175694 RepID=UPI0021E6E8EC|nr:DEAD-box ATP-dependent RNA helicase 5 isoform X2 [Andrographis paniculata]XP_051129537.1 DEAD-box ATP-dependent RNA helicase 5 isoform X2 [Andrographis paniculata]